MGFQNYPWATGQSTLTGAASQILPANPARSGVVIENTGTNAVYIGENSTVSTSTGYLIPGVVGASIAFATTGAIYGITAGPSETVTYLQTQ
jgi:hypothetical protein